MSAVPARSEIAKEFTWNAESVFATRDDWRAEFDAVSAELEPLSRFAGTLSSSAATLIDWLETVSRVRRRVSKLFFYANMSAAVDTNDEAAKAMTGQAQSLFAHFAARTAFAQPEMIAIGEATLRNWLKNEPQFALYEQMVTQLFRMQVHVRSAEVEEILGMTSDPFGSSNQAAGMLTNADLTFQDAVGSDGAGVPITQSNIGTLLQSPDRELRRTAWENYADAHLNFKNTLAGLYLTSVKQQAFFTRVRGYQNALEAILYPFNLSADVFHNLINTFKANIPTWHRYWEVRRKALRVDQLHPYDIWAPLTTNEPHVPYTQAVDWIVAGMTPLGEDYTSILRRGCLEDRWVDVYPNQGKRQGAFSYGSYDTFPFIMMSYDDSLKGLSTLAHELGHSMHSYYSRRTQPEMYSSYSMFVAEVASNFNQAMVRAHLFAHQSDANFQIALIEEAMSNFHRYFFIMPTLARFEMEVHSRIEAGKPLTADMLNGIMSELFAEGYGATMTDDPTRTGITWAQFGHLYAPFYTFQYATGISAAHALADGILAGQDGAVENYLGMLKAGGASYPIDALRDAGIDMSTPAAVEKTFRVLSDLVDRLERLTQ